MSTQQPLRYGSQVRRRREELGLTREMLAHNSGVSTSTVARLELDDKLPSAEGLARIARQLGISLDGLLGAKIAEASA